MGGSGGWASENVLELTPDSAGTVMKPSIGCSRASYRKFYLHEASGRNQPR